MLINISPAHAAEITIHVVKPGENLGAIAKKYGTSVEDLKVTNGLSSNVIHKGQKLKISPKKYNMQGQYILLTKEEFKEWLFNNEFNRKISIIQQHHTWLPSYKHFHGSNHFNILHGMETYHVKKMRWKNIAQNITTFPDGLVAVSRPFNMAPEGSIGPKANATGISIENIGNFDIGCDVMSKEQKETIVYITALLCIKFGLTPSIDTITYHHWWHYKTGERVLDNAAKYDVKTCPGTGFFGGNTTENAKTHFYPLVSRKMQEILASMN